MKPSSLRTEIIITLAFLMGAAVLLTGFLLIRLNEQELLKQKIEATIGFLEFASNSIVAAGCNGEVVGLEEKAGRIMNHVPSTQELEGWVLFDDSLKPVSSQSWPEPDPIQHPLGQIRFGETAMEIHYASGWPFLSDGEETFLLLTVPLLERGNFQGAILARFSLASIRAQVARAHRLTLFFGVLYGIVLVLSGVFLLNRAVVKPLRDLVLTTHRVAGGQLDETPVKDRLKEIAELAGAFNFMVAALKESRAQTETQIRSLGETNLELQRTRDELVHSEKLASVGHLAAGMAHEIGNPLGALLGYLNILNSDLATGFQRDLVVRSLSEAQRIDHLIRDLLDYAAPGANEAEEVDPSAVLREAVEVLAHQNVFAARTVHDDLPATLPDVRLIRHKLLQVFINLLLNARDAGSAGGMIRLGGGADGGWVWLAVEDHGCGIDPDLLPHIFDPFFTTKPPGKGRGLGLFVCHRIVEEAGGRMEVRSEPGKGSTFIIRLSRQRGEDVA